MDIVTYQTTVNKTCEEFKLSQLSNNQFKCLIFIMGLQSKSDLEIRTKLLAKLDSHHAAITLQQLADECERLQPHKPCGEFHKSDEECPAKKTICITCHLKGHFSECCFKRNKLPKEEDENSKANSSKNVQSKEKNSNNKSKVAIISVHQVNSSIKIY